MTNGSSTSTAAVISLIAGILAWLVLPIVGALAAVIAGHMARGEIRRTPGMEGDGLAIAGLILGYLQLVLAVLAAMIAMLAFAGIIAVGVLGS